MSQSPLERALTVYVQMTSREPDENEIRNAVDHIEALKAGGDTDDERLTVRALTFLRVHDNVERIRSPAEAL